jgi:hypothetical protein
MFYRLRKVKPKINIPNGWWCMPPEPVPADPGWDDAPARYAAEPELALAADAAVGPDDCYAGASDAELAGVLSAWDRRGSQPLPSFQAGSE